MDDGAVLYSKRDTGFPPTPALVVADILAHLHTPPARPLALPSIPHSTLFLAPALLLLAAVTAAVFFRRRVTSSP